MHNEVAYSSYPSTICPTKVIRMEIKEVMLVITCIKKYLYQPADLPTYLPNFLCLGNAGRSAAEASIINSFLNNVITEPHVKNMFLVSKIAGLVRQGWHEHYKKPSQVFSIPRTRQAQLCPFFEHIKIDQKNNRRSDEKHQWLHEKHQRL